MQRINHHLSTNLLFHINKHITNASYVHHIKDNIIQESPKPPLFPSRLTPLAHEETYNARECVKPLSRGQSIYLHTYTYAHEEKMRASELLFRFDSRVYMDTRDNALSAEKWRSRSASTMTQYVRVEPRV